MCSQFAVEMIFPMLGHCLCSGGRVQGKLTIPGYQQLIANRIGMAGWLQSLAGTHESLEIKSQPPTHVSFFSAKKKIRLNADSKRGVLQIGSSAQFPHQKLLKPSDRKCQLNESPLIGMKTFQIANKLLNKREFKVSLSAPPITTRTSVQFLNCASVMDRRSLCKGFLSSVGERLWVGRGERLELHTHTHKKTLSHGHG